MIRRYLTHDKVTGFCPLWPAAYQSLRNKVDSEWVPAMKNLLTLDRQMQPVIWDADSLYGPGEGTYVLSEINVTAVWQLPQASVQNDRTGRNRRDFATSSEDGV